MQKNLHIFLAVVATFLYTVPASLGWITYPSILHLDGLSELQNNSGSNSKSKSGDKLFFTELIEEFAPELNANGTAVSKGKRNEEVQ